MENDIKIKDAISRILSEAEIDITLEELASNTSVIGSDAENLIELSEYYIQPGTLKIFNLEDKNYYSEIRGWNGDVQKYIELTHKSIEEAMKCANNEGKFLAKFAIKIIDSRNCQYDNCPGSVYAFDSLKNNGYLGSRIIHKTCENFKLCDKVIGAFMGIEKIDMKK